MTDQDRAHEELVSRLLRYAETVGVGQVWVSTLRMSQALGHTDHAVADTLEAIRQAGAPLPDELVTALERLRGQDG